MEENNGNQENNKISGNSVRSSRNIKTTAVREMIKSRGIRRSGEMRRRTKGTRKVVKFRIL